MRGREEERVGEREREREGGRGREREDRETDRERASEGKTEGWRNVSAGTPETDSSKRVQHSG